MNSGNQKSVPPGGDLSGDRRVRELIYKKRAILDGLEDVDAKISLLIEVGELWQNQLQNSQKATANYLEALRLKPDDRPLLHKLLPLYQADGQWEKVLDLISRIAGLEGNPERQSQHYFTMAVIYRDELGREDDALEYFDSSLDSNAENLKAFEAVELILTKRNAWDALEGAYRKQVLRLEGKGRTDLESSTWYFLGEIYRTRLNDREQAVEAYEKVLELDPDNVKCHESLAVLYVYLPSRIPDAFKACQWLIQRDPFHADYYKSLFYLYVASRDFDKAWCVSATLTFLQKADKDEKAFFEKYRTTGIVPVQARLDNQHWLKNLFHPEESVYVGKILEAVTSVARRIKIQPIKLFGLKKRQKKTQKDKEPIAQIFYHAAQVLNVPVIPDLYIQKSRQGALQYAITEPMTTVCGNGLLSGYTYQDLLYIIGKHLTYYRPEHYIRRILPSHAEIKMIMLAAIKTTMPETRMPEDTSGLLDQYISLLETELEPVEREHLAKVVNLFVQKGEVVDIERWVQCVELTGCRAGFLLCNDLDVAVRMIRLENVTEDYLSPKEKIKDLVLFSTSEEYFRLRKYLGISIAAPQ